MEEKITHLNEIAKRLRYLILISSSEAGSGHPTSALSATDIMAGLFFGGAFRYDLQKPENPANDRIIFSKGHATPLYYSLWAVTGKLTEEDMRTYRKFNSPLEGHPTTSFPYVDAATGSLGQGLSIGLGMALNAKYLDNLSCNTYVLLGDSEMAEGSQWEALQIAAHYELDNLVGILDVNRLGQRGATMYEHDLEAYRSRIEAFGWETVTIDGHSFSDILSALENMPIATGRPTMIIAKTVKGKGVSFLEDRDGYHGKAVPKQELDEALKELGDVNREITGGITSPPLEYAEKVQHETAAQPDYSGEDAVATRAAYGNALKRIYPAFPQIVSLDGEVSNSTKSVTFKEAYPERFFEMYIAEQNMVSAALGFSCRGRIPFVSTFAAFLTRAFDQIRMAQYSEPNIKFVGSHAGVSIGEDGPSQMGLEDIAMFRTIRNGTVLYPCDAISTERLTEEMAQCEGICYLRTTRGKTPLLYSENEAFRIGGSKILRESIEDQITVVAAGVTVFEALEACDELRASENIPIRVIDLYSVKPLDEDTLRKAADCTKGILTVEDHYPEGGIGEAVTAALSDHPVPVYSLAVPFKPKSGTSAELLEYEEISKTAIVNALHKLLEE